ncbi:hypothetical protein Hanom_Chr07g00593631 [Helianthus anomalus]
MVGQGDEGFSWNNVVPKLEGVVFIAEIKPTPNVEEETKTESFELQFLRSVFPTAFVESFAGYFTEGLQITEVKNAEEDSHVSFILS